MKIIFLFIVFLLLFNIVFSSIDITGYTLYQYSASYTINLPDTLIEDDGYLIIARNCDKASFETFWGITLDSNVIFYNSGDSFAINGDEIYSLYDNVSALIDSTTSALISGNTVQRDSTNVNTWTQSADSNATPGSGVNGGHAAGLVITEYSDASGVGNYIYEFIEIYYDVSGTPSNTPPSISSVSHSPSPVIEGDIVIVSATITDDNNIIADTLFYNVNGGSFNSVLHDSISSSKYFYTLGSFVLNDSVSYYIKAIDDSNAITTSSTYSFNVVESPVYDIKINEFVSNGPSGGDGPSEWIELYNTGADSINIGNYTLSDGEDSFTLPQYTMAPGEFYVCVNNFDSFDVYYNLPIGVNYFEYGSIAPSFLLSNTGDEISLYDTNMVLIDYVNYGTGTNPASNPGDSLSASRNPDGQDTDNCTDDFIILSSPTPGSAVVSGPSITNLTHNPLFPLSSESDTIFCDVSDPDGVKSVYVITSAYDSTQIDTFSMSLFSGNTYYYVVPPKDNGCRFEYFVYAVDSVSDTSISSDKGRFFWGYTNIPKLKQIDNVGFPRYYGYLIRSTGIVTTPSNVYSTSADIINFQESYVLGAVIKADTSNPNVIPGDSITALGTIGFWNGQTRIQDPNASIILHSSSHPIDTTYITADDLMDTVGEDREGLLVSIDCYGIHSGTWPTPGSNAGLWMKNDSIINKGDLTDTFYMWIDADTDIDDSIEPSWNNRIIGIISQYDLNSPYFEGYQIMPRAYEDVDNTLNTAINEFFMSINLQNNGYNIKWHINTIKQIHSIRIERRKLHNKHFDIIAIVPENKNEYNDNNVDFSQIYEYRITIIFLDGKSVSLKPIKTSKNMQIKNMSFSINTNIVLNSTYLKILSNKQQNIDIKLFDISGRMIKEIYSGNINAGINNIFVNVSDLISGTYFLNIENPDIKQSIKICKIKK